MCGSWDGSAHDAVFPMPTGRLQLNEAHGQSHPQCKDVSADSQLQPIQSVEGDGDYKDVGCRMLTANLYSRWSATLKRHADMMSSADFTHSQRNALTPAKPLTHFEP